MRLPEAIRVAFERSEKRLDEQVGRLERVRVEPAPRAAAGNRAGALARVEAGLAVRPAGCGGRRGGGAVAAPMGWYAARTWPLRRSAAGRADRQRDTGDMPLIDSELGTVTPLATVTVQTQISGQLQQVGFTEGQMVKKGDFLAQIDPRPYQARWSRRRARWPRTRALLAQAQADLARYQTLNRQDSIARQQVDDQVLSGAAGPGHGAGRPGRRWTARS